MCDGNLCPVKNECYRHTAKPNPYRQSYFGSPPYTASGCEYFGPNEHTTRKEFVITPEEQHEQEIANELGTDS